MFVTRFSQVPVLTLYVSLRSRSLLPLLSPSSTSPGRALLHQMHRSPCRGLQTGCRRRVLETAGHLADERHSEGPLKVGPVL